MTKSSSPRPRAPRPRRPRSCWSTTTAPTTPPGSSASCSRVTASVRAGLAEPQLRPARRDARRDGLRRRRVDRHHGRGRPARPRRHPGDCWTGRMEEQVGVVYATPRSTWPPHRLVPATPPRACPSGSSTCSAAERRTPRCSTATGWCSGRTAAASPPTPAPGSTSTSPWAGWPDAPATVPGDAPPRGRAGSPGYTPAQRCCRTSGGWCSPAAPGCCAWSAVLGAALRASAASCFAGRPRGGQARPATATCQPAGPR